MSEVCPFCNEPVLKDSNQLIVASKLYHKSCWKDALRKGTKILPTSNSTASLINNTPTKKLKPPTTPAPKPPQPTSSENPTQDVEFSVPLTPTISNSHHQHHKQKHQPRSQVSSTTDDDNSLSSVYRMRIDVSESPPASPRSRNARSSTIGGDSDSNINKLVSSTFTSSELETTTGSASATLATGNTSISVPSTVPSPTPEFNQTDVNCSSSNSNTNNNILPNRPKTEPVPSQTQQTPSKMRLGILNRLRVGKDPSNSPSSAENNNNNQQNETTQEKLKASGLKRAIVDPSCITFGDKIGEGATGIVFRAKVTKKKKKKMMMMMMIGSQEPHTETIDAAVKMIRNPEFLTPDQKDEFIREVSLLKKLRSPYIVKFIGVVATVDKLYLVTEFISGGMLRDVISKKQVPWPIRARIALDTAHGLSALHSSSIIHRDLKSENILVVSLSLDAPSTVKLIDFGASRTIKDNCQRFYTKGVGTPIYMSPEILKGEAYSKSTDVFSFGVLLWELLSQKQPYADFTSPWKVTQFVISGSRLPLPQDTPNDIATLVSACWSQHQQDRPTTSRIVQIITNHLKNLSKHS